MYPQVVKDVEAYLKTCTFDFPKDMADVDEETTEEVIDMILGKFDGEQAERWYNMILNDGSNDIYCIVQVIASKEVKIHQKEAFVQSLTCMDVENIDDDMSLNDMHKCVKDHMLDDRDYLRECYFIFIDAIDCTVMVRSVCDIVSYQLNKDIVDNPCEVLQIDWEKEKSVETLQYNNIIEIKNGIFKAIAESVMYLMQNSEEFLDKNST